MEYKQLEAFVNVVKHKSFSKAADATFFTQPTLSMHVRALEKEVGVKLIDRTGKESIPTAEGKTLYEHALKMLSDRNKAIEDIVGIKCGQNGILDIRTSSIPSKAIVPQLMAGFKEKVSDVRFYVEQSDSKKVWEDIKEGRGDIGFVGAKTDDSLETALLFTEKSVLITPNNERFSAMRAESDTVRLEDVKNELFITREEGSATKHSFERELMDVTKSKNNRTVAVVNNISILEECVINGLGVSIVSKSAVRDNAGYLYFNIDKKNMDRSFYLVWNKKNKSSNLVKEFIEYARRYYKK
ncbi:MAG: selenium metabolism-associated LysR family transcriptional regulator [Eubacteriales bacterium]|nr:selenium metabolism-associated LysR family transcriptional regulator [Eubacteriales bacterium]MDY3332299.1 selenium metabolism-associated LysR family transcriptional regulator [Gallibacter sp.]